MTNSQFQLLTEMFAQLSRRMDKLESDITSVRTDLRKEMQDGFKRQEAISMEILRTMGETVPDLASDFTTIKRNHEARLSRLEARLT